MAANAIVFALGLLGLEPLIASLFPDRSADSTSVVRVSWGFANHSIPVTGAPVFDAGIGGNAPGIALWDDFGTLIGSAPSDGSTIGQGNFKDTHIVAPPNPGNVPPAYLGVSNGGNNASCIAAVTVTAPDGQTFQWTGDVASFCSATTGAYVYPSALEVLDPSSSVKSTPYCVWIDRDGSNGIPHQGFGIHLPDFGHGTTKEQVAAYRADPRLLCSSGPRYRMYPQMTTGTPILTFQPPPNYGPDGVDIDPSYIINNPGVQADADKVLQVLECRKSPKLPECSTVSVPTYVPVVHGRTAEAYNSAATGSSSMTYLPSSKSARFWSNNSVSSEAHQSVSLGLNWSRTTFVTSGLVKTSTATTVSSVAGSTESSTPSGAAPAHHLSGHLVITSQAYHSAKELCEHPFTFGPSMVSLVEGLFCDMIGKKIYPVCGSLKSNTDCCFDTDAWTLHGCPDADSAQDAQVDVTRSNETASRFAATVSGQAVIGSRFNHVYQW